MSTVESHQSSFSTIVPSLSLKEPQEFPAHHLLSLNEPVRWSRVSPGPSKALNPWSHQRLFGLLLIISFLIFLLPLSASHAAQVTLAWEANTEPSLAGYKIYYGTTSRDYDWSIDVGKTMTYTVSNLTDGVTYYFAAKAYTTAKTESTYSAEAVQNTCTYSISPTSARFTASGGTGTVSVTTQTGCPWTASSGVSWLTIASGASGSGSGTVKYSVAANTGTSSRTASSTFAKNVFSVTQAGTVEAPNHTITASAGTGGTISPSGSVVVTNGESKTFAIAPGAGHKISTVTVDGVSKGAINTYTFSNVTANHTIKATFELVIDDGQSGTTPVGTWLVSYGSGPYGTRSLYNFSTTGSYTFQAERSGLQGVYLWWTTHSSRNTKVPVRIYNGATLLALVYVNQTQNGGKWNYLGKYSFSGPARIQIVSTSSTLSACADAVRFVPSP